MKAAGIIAEYNPFHNGHAYQLAQARQFTNADYIIVAMSGNFVQRGVPAILDKYTRAQMALAAGADLVIELPSIHATASAEYFASAGVLLLGATGVVDHLCYGVESLCGTLADELAKALLHPSAAYEDHLSNALRAGKSFPLARQEALCVQLKHYPKEQLVQFLSSPNNILSLEYEKAIAQWNLNANRPIKGCAILRTGDSYHDTSIHSAYASATAIRRLLLDSKDQTQSLLENPGELSAVLPATSIPLLEEAKTRGLLMDAEDFSEALYMQLLTHRQEGYEAFADCSTALSHRIANQLHSYRSFLQFADLLKTKELTHTRVCRVLTHILLGITKEEYEISSCPYIRVLGFRKSAQPLLSEISKKASAPLVTKVADASHILSDSALKLLSKDIYAADLYRGICSIKSNQSLPNEYTQPLPIL